MTKLTMNIIPFDYPSKTIPLSIYDNVGEDTREIHRSLFSYEFWESVDYDFESVTHLHCRFALDDEATYSLDLRMKDYPRLSKHFFNVRLIQYFHSLGVMAFENFVGDTEVWVPDSSLSTEAFTYYRRFTLRPMYGRVSSKHELMLAYDGLTQVFNTSLEDLHDIPQDLFTSIVTGGRTRSLVNMTPEDKLALGTSYPIMNLGIKRHLGIKIEGPDQDNKYIKYKGQIDSFYNTYLLSEDFTSIFNHSQDGFYKLPNTKIRRTFRTSNTLRFGRNNTEINPYNGIRDHGPYSPSSHAKVVFFFIFQQSDFELVKNLNTYLTKGYKHFKGLRAFIKQTFDTEPKGSLAFTNLQSAVQELKEFLAQKSYSPDTRYVALYVTPINKFEQDLAQREIYYKVKEQLLKYNITSQAIHRETISATNFNYSLPNIAVAILAKLDGIPWRLDREQSNELIVGVGAFAPSSSRERYIGSAFCFTNQGKFHGFECFTSDEVTLLAASIREAILTYLDQHRTAERLIIHFYKTMSRAEITPIMKVLDFLGIDIPIIIVTINKTISKDFVAFDASSPALMPISGTFIRVGFNKFLLFNNSRYGGDGTGLRSYPFPIVLAMQCTEEGYLDDYKIVTTLVDQVYQFSRMYWKSVAQQNLPVTIKYSEMVAQMFPHFDGDIIPDFGKTNLWFL